MFSMFKNIVWIAAEKKRTEDNSVLPLWNIVLMFMIPDSTGGLN